jgi:HAD superfamily hydrolase (TIGR01509 family)
MLQALIFDVDGTLADTEMAHLDAFNQAFHAEGLDWRWDVPLYTRLLEVSGGKERLWHYWNEVSPGQLELNGTPRETLIERLHSIKTQAYEAAVNEGRVQWRPGVRSLMEDARRQGVRLAIATTTSRPNVQALLRQGLGEGWETWFEVIEDASTAPQKKPHPQAYLQALARLGVPAQACLAFEDSANGLRAAMRAGLATVVTANSFTRHHRFNGAWQFWPDLSNTSLAALQATHALRTPQPVAPSAALALS